MMLEFHVYGHPETKGNLRTVRFRDKHTGELRVLIREGNPSVRDWMNRVAEAARRVHTGVACPGGVILAVEFVLPRPKSLPRKITHHIKRPDLSKLIRAVEDALIGVVYHDDSQIIELHVSKRYNDDTESTFALVRIESAEPPAARPGVRGATERGRQGAPGDEADRGLFG